MLSTAGELLWPINILTVLLFFFLCVAAYSLYVTRRLRTEFPSKTLLNKVRAEIDSLSGDLADLTLRFSRFQKREGMSAAREAKRSAASLQAEAAEILQSGSGSLPGSSPKAELYKKARH